MARSLASPWVSAHLRHLPKRGTALDLGCGRGRHARLLHDLGLCVTAVDRDAEALARLPQGPQPLQRDVELEGLEQFGAFDVVLVVNYANRELLPRPIREMPSAMRLFEGGFQLLVACWKPLKAFEGVSTFDFE